MPENELITLESPDVVAFIQLRTNLTPSPALREQDHHVTFSFPSTPETKAALSDFYKNVPVNIVDYTKNLKSVRSTIYNLRAGGRNGK